MSGGQLKKAEAKHSKLNWADASEKMCHFGDKCTQKKCRFEHNVGRGQASTKTIDGVISAARSVLVRRADYLRKAAEFDRKYVMVADAKDVKSESPYADALKLCDVEFAQLRQVARSLMGPMKSIRINLVENVFYATGVTGSCLAVATVDPTALTEFGSLAALFDEFKVVGGEYHYGLLDWVPNTTTTALSYGTLAYDPSDGTNPTSEVSLLQKQQTQMVLYGTLIAGSLSPTIVHPGGHTFKYRVPPGVLVAAGATASEGTSNWQPTASTNGYQPYGWLKYAKTGVHNSVTQISGVNVYHCEFRSRE